MSISVFEPGFLAQFSRESVLQAFFQTAYLQNCGFAAWRLPQDNQIQVIITFKPAVIPENFKIESAPVGFIFHPFQISESCPAYFLQADLFVQFNFSEQESKLTVLHEGAEADRFLTRLNSVLDEFQNGESNPDWFFNTHPTATVEKHEFEALVSAGIGLMNSGGAEKIVLSRSERAKLTDDFHPVSAFLTLAGQYSHAFISLVSLPEAGTWLGASPEILVQKDSNNFFKTIALAGTQKLENGLLPSEAIWRQKEIEEQSMVVRYIISCFKKIRLREYVETGPRTVVAGNLMHLRSDFCVDLSETDFPEITTEMLHLLHPTSAVCGQPKEAALHFIQENENYDRRYYSGYLGPVNVNQETAIFVNLRCLELKAETAVLYAGAGTMPDSDPAKEWQETELKMQTLKAALKL